MRLLHKKQMLVMIFFQMYQNVNELTVRVLLFSKDL